MDIVLGAFKKRLKEVLYELPGLLLLVAWNDPFPTMGLPTIPSEDEDTGEGLGVAVWRYRDSTVGRVKWGTGAATRGYRVPRLRRLLRAK